VTADERVAFPQPQAGWEVVDDADRTLASARTGQDAPRDLAELDGVVQAEFGPVQILGHELSAHGVVVTYAVGCLVERVHYSDGTPLTPEGLPRVRGPWEDVELPQVYAEEHPDDLS
jgi:hypothetical protein